MCLLTRTLYACSCPTSSIPKIQTYCSATTPGAPCPQAQRELLKATELPSPKLPGSTKKTTSPCPAFDDWQDYCCSQECCLTQHAEAKFRMSESRRALEKAKGKSRKAAAEEQKFWEVFLAFQGEEERHRCCAMERFKREKQEEQEEEVFKGTALDAVMENSVMEWRFPTATAAGRVAA